MSVPRQAGLLLWISILGGAQPAFAADPAWSTYQGNAEHTGFVDVQIVWPVTNVPRWTKQLSPDSLPAGGSFIGLAIANGMVYVTSELGNFPANNPIVAASLIDGSVIWEKNFPGIFAVNPPAVSPAGDVYFTTVNHQDDTYLHRLDGATGEFRFSTPMEAQWQRLLAPTIVGDQVATPGGYGSGLHVFSLEGEFLYSTPNTWYDRWTPVPWGQFWVYLTDELTIVDRATGIHVRTIAIPNYSWSGWSIGQTPVIVGDSAYYVQNNRLIAIDLNDGTLQFDRAASFYQSPFLDPQIMTDGQHLFVRGYPHMAVISPDGDLVDSYSFLPWAGFGPLNVVTRNHFIGWTSDGQIGVIDRASRSVVRSFDETSDIAGIALADSTLVVAYRDGRVSAFDAPFAIFADSFD